MTKTKTKNDILAQIRDHQSVIKALGVERLGLFGSFARGEQNRESDVDLLVEFRRESKTFDNFMGLSFFLEELLERRIELVTKEALSPHFGPYILAEVEDVPLTA